MAKITRTKSKTAQHTARYWTLAMRHDVRPLCEKLARDEDRPLNVIVQDALEMYAADRMAGAQFAVQVVFDSEESAAIGNFARKHKTSQMQVVRTAVRVALMEGDDE